MKKEQKEIILFDTEDYVSDEFDTTDEMIDEVQYLIDEYTNKPRGEVSQWVLLAERSSRYGAISHHGATGYKDLKTDNLAQALMSCTPNSERIVIKATDGELQVDYFDHDGTNHCVVKSVSKSKGEYYSNVVEYDSFQNKIRFIEKLPTLKIKKSAIKQING